VTSVGGRPEWTVTRIEAPGPPAAFLDDAAWETVVPMPPFRRSEDAGPARWPTTVRLALARATLHVRFDCEDDDPWGTYLRRDDPLYEQEVVEVFLAVGDADPARYYEFEVSPVGSLLDAVVTNPGTSRRDLRADLGWNCPGLSWRATAFPEAAFWRAELAIPLRSLTDSRASGTWRANFHRIERPRGGTDEFSSWSPTLVSPPDFHKPERFGVLRLPVSRGDDTPPANAEAPR
jgi:hypothetical protein